MQESPYHYLQACRQARRGTGLKWTCWTHIVEGVPDGAIASGIQQRNLRPQHIHLGVAVARCHIVIGCRDMQDVSMRQAHQDECCSSLLDCLLPLGCNCAAQKNPTKPHEQLQCCQTRIAGSLHEHGRVCRHMFLNSLRSRTYACRLCCPPERFVAASKPQQSLHSS